MKPRCEEDTKFVTVLNGFRNCASVGVTDDLWRRRPGNGRHAMPLRLLAVAHAQRRALSAVQPLSTGQP
jgi:hypothetical protein